MKLIWMIADKLYSNVSLFIVTSYIMVLLHNFLYIQKIFFRLGTGSVYHDKLYKFILQYLDEVKSMHVVVPCKRKKLILIYFQ